MIVIPHEYTYLLGTLIFLIPWIILYWARKDLRKEMWFMSVGVAVGSFITAYMWWTIDWWRPDTITGTRVGVEDLILGFSNGGIAAVLYEGIFKKRLYKRKKKVNDFGALFVCVLIFLIISFLFWGLNITSFKASSIAMVIGAALLIYARKDLIFNALASGFLMALVSLPVYYILIILSPNWVEKTWLSNTLSGIKVTNIPIEDLIFYFLFGFLVGPFYEYWQNKRLRKIPE